jgi:beta-lactamase superfamily II metal-dependent hydrolase
MPVATLFDSGQTYSGRAYSDCIASAHAHNVPIILARRGMQWPSGDDVNENSIVVMLRAQTTRDQTFRELFMGDAGEASEARLLAEDAPCHPEQRRGAAENMAGGDPSTLLGMTRSARATAGALATTGALAATRALATTDDGDLHADVIKVGHHGSRYASTSYRIG